MPTGLGDDLDAALHQPELASVGLAIVERYAGEFALEMRDRFTDIDRLSA